MVSLAIHSTTDLTSTWIDDATAILRCPVSTMAAHMHATCDTLSVLLWKLNTCTDLVACRVLWWLCGACVTTAGGRNNIVAAAAVAVSGGEDGGKAADFVEEPYLALTEMYAF